MSSCGKVCISLRGFCCKLALSMQTMSPAYVLSQTRPSKTQKPILITESFSELCKNWRVSTDQLFTSELTVWKPRSSNRCGFVAISVPVNIITFHTFACLLIFYSLRYLDWGGAKWSIASYFLYISETIQPIFKIF